MQARAKTTESKTPLKHPCCFHLADIIDVFCHPYFSTSSSSSATHRHGGVARGGPGTKKVAGAKGIARSEKGDEDGCRMAVGGERESKTALIRAGFLEYFID